MSGPSSATPELPPGALDDRSHTVIGAVVFCLVFATVMVSLRTWTRQRVLHEMGWDDYACILGLIATIGSGISTAHMTKYGLGKHVNMLNPPDIPFYLRDFYLSVVFYCAALFAIKMAFLFQYYRVLAVQHMRIVYLIVIVIVGGWSLSQVFVGIFLCTPIAGFWDAARYPNAKCIPNFPQFWINAAGNIVTDLAVFALPLPAIWKLNLRKQQKYLLLGIFSLGFFTVIISLVRIKYLKVFADFSWENVDSSIWSIGELTSALTCACLPTLRPLLTRVFPSLGAVPGQSGNNGKSSANALGIRGSGGGGTHLASRKGHTDVDLGTHYNNKSRKGSGRGGLAGSEVELASNGEESPFERHVRRAGQKKGGDGGGDESSVASSELALAPKQPGIQVRTEISQGDATDRAAAMQGRVHGVQVQREVYQTREMNQNRQTTVRRRDGEEGAYHVL